MKSKKAVELSLSTIVIFIIALIVIIIALLFLTNVGGPVIEAFRSRGDIAINMTNP